MRPSVLWSCDRSGYQLEKTTQEGDIKSFRLNIDNISSYAEIVVFLAADLEDKSLISSMY